MNQIRTAHVVLICLTWLLVNCGHDMVRREESAAQAEIARAFRELRDKAGKPSAEILPNESKL